MALAMPDGSITPETAWAALTRELDAWSTEGRTASFWWRDDDASEPTQALDALLEIQGETGVPLALAVVPATATGALRDKLSRSGDVTVLQHGYSHKNFASDGARKIELDGSRPAEYVIADLAMGAQALSRFEAHLPVLVPPWNRMAPHLVPLLPEIGFRGLSTNGIRARDFPVRGLVQNNVHLDVIDWRGRRTGSPRNFLGAENVISDAIEHLTARRTGAADTSEVTGLMTHHADMGADAIGFVVEFVTRTNAHPAVSWLPANEVFSVS
ncbi:MAG: hypothetical protein CL566_04465 [Alphaproteobacteria bacterium]|nr:hypothetical protein [Alphaproteobacteria bacterium]